jgi:hypothetical protein
VTRPIDRLRELFRAEHAEPTAPEASWFVEEILRRHGGAVSAILFYGSCLRKKNVIGGVLDFYAVVDSYRAAYGRGLLAVANAVLPPNVFMVSVRHGSHEAHAKYAVVSSEDFARGVTGETLHSIVWARFCQPARLLFVRDAAAREAVAGDSAEAAVTMVRTAMAIRGIAGEVDLDPEALWQEGFRATYGTELRTERPETIRELFAAAPERYATVTALAVEELAARGELVLPAAADRPLHVVVDPDWSSGLAKRWRRRTPLAKSVYFFRLIKSAFTFGDWLPYALWKLGRHTGVSVELTPLQRRYPLIFGWPVIVRLLLSQKLR